MKGLALGQSVSHRSPHSMSRAEKTNKQSRNLFQLSKGSHIKYTLRKVSLFCSWVFVLVVFISVEESLLSTILSSLRTSFEHVKKLPSPPRSCHYCLILSKHQNRREHGRTNGFSLYSVFYSCLQSAHI